MRTSPSRLVALGAAIVLVLAACGDDAPDASVDSGLRPPVPVQVVSAGGGGVAGAEMASDRVAGDANDLSIDPSSSFLPWFVGFEYEVGAGLPALPTDSTAYQYVPGIEVDPDTVTALAAALGVTGEPTRGGGAQVDGVAWRIGPDDGTAPSFTVLADSQSSWYYSSAWAIRTEPAEIRCAVPLEGEGSGEATDPDARSSDAGSSDAGSSDAGSSDGGDVVVSDRDEVSDDVPVEPVVEECLEYEPPTPPIGVPTAEQAEQRARELLAAAGQDPARFQYETFADEWYASVNAFDQLGGLRSPASWGFGFGGEGVLEWAGGILAVPVATGPYPLIDLDGALARLTEQSTGWWGLRGDIEPALVDPAVDTAVDVVDEPVVDPAIEPSSDSIVVPVPEQLPEMELELAVLVDVRADFWWAWDDDGSVWLLPAYTFTDTEGRVHTVPAVTDEYLIVAESVEVLPDDVIPEPAPLPDEPDVAPGEPDASWIEIGDELLGLTLEEATERVEALGGSIRVLREDGEDLAGTDDLVPTRVNVAVEAGVVVEILSIG